MPFDFGGGYDLTPEQQQDPEELLKRQKQSKPQPAGSSAKPQASQPSTPQKPQQQQAPAAQKPQQPRQQQGPNMAQPLQGLGKWMEENIAIPANDFIDNTFQGDKKTPEQIGAERQQQRGVFNEQMRTFEDTTRKDPAAELIRAGAGGVEDFWEGVYNLPGQASNAMLGTNFKPAEFSFIKENNTQWGEGTRTLSRYVVGSFVGQRLTGGRLTAGQSGAALFGGRATQGFLENFLGASGDGDDGTLIGNTPFTKWLQTNDANDPLVNRTIVGVEGALFEAVGIPGVKALADLMGVPKAIKALGDSAKGWQKASARKKIDKLFSDIAVSEGLASPIGNGPVVDALIKGTAPIDAAFDALDNKLRNASPWVRKAYGVILGEDIPVDEVEALLAETSRMLTDPQVLRDQKRVKLVAETQRAIREVRAADLAKKAQARLKLTLMTNFAQDSFEGTLDYTKVTERDFALRLIQEDPSRLKLNALIAQAAGTADPTDPIFSYLKARTEAYKASQYLDEVANTVRYGGAPDELVVDATRIDVAHDRIAGFDGQIRTLEGEVAKRQTAVTTAQSLIDGQAKAGATKSQQIAGLMAELDTLPSQADLEKAAQINLSLSKAQVDRLNNIGLPEGVSITPGRRVVGLTAENIDDVRASVAELAAGGDKVAQNLSVRLDELDVPQKGEISQVFDQLGKGITEVPRRQMWEAYQKGETQVAKVFDPYLDFLQRAREKGIVANTQEEFNKLLDRAIQEKEKRALGGATPRADIRTREGVQQMLEQLQAERQDLFNGQVQGRLDRLRANVEMRNMRAQLDELNMAKRAQQATITGTKAQFEGAYVPVNLSSKNITSIVKESGGGQPGFDLYFEDKKFGALLPGRVKEIGRQGNQQAGYGNFIVVESLDPKTGQSVDVLYAHLADNSILVKEGDMITPGQQIGTQGGTGSVRSVDGTIASVDFLAPAAKGSGSMTPYSRWSELVDELSTGIRQGNIEVSSTGKAIADAPAVPPQRVVEAAQVADETATTMTRKEAMEAGYEVDNLTTAAPRSSLVDTFTEDLDLDSVVGTAQPGKQSLTTSDVRGLADENTDSLKMLEELHARDPREIKFTEAEAFNDVLPEAEKYAKEWLGMEADADLNAFIRKVDAGGAEYEGTFFASRTGFATAGLVLKELMRQATDLSHGIVNASKDGLSDAATKGVQLIDNMMAATKIRGDYKQISSGTLRSKGYIDEAMAGSPSVNQAKSSIFKQRAAAKADELTRDKIIYQELSNMRQAIRDGDPAAFNRLKRIAQTMAVMPKTAENFNVVRSLISANIKNVDGLHINLMLTGPKTQAKNFWSGAYMTMGHPLQAYLSSWFKGAEGSVLRNQAVASLTANAETLQEMTSLMGRLWQFQSKQLDPAIKDYHIWDETLVKRMDSITAMKQTGELGFMEEMAYGTAMAGHKLLRAPQMTYFMRAAGSVDSFFKVAAGRQTAARMAVEQALESMGEAPLTAMRSEKFADLVVDFKEANLKEIFEADGITFRNTPMGQQAQSLGQTFTFQTPPGESDKLTKGLNTLANIPGMRTLGLTFIQTPSAILKTTANITPGLSSILKQYDQTYKNADAYTRAVRDGAEAMSVIFGFSAFFAGAQGVVTGAGPLGNPERDIWMRSHKPFTMTFPGGMEWNYQALEPAATMLGLCADWGALAFGERAGEEDRAISVLTAVMSNIVNKSYLAQIATASQVLTSRDPKQLGKLGENIARNLGIPFASSFRNQVGQVVDPAVREARSTLEPTWSWYLKKHLGFGSTAALPQAVDEVTGKPLTRDGVDNPLASRFLSGVNMLAPLGLNFSKERFRPVHKFLYKEGIAIDDDRKTLNNQDMTNEEIVEYTKLRAGNGALEKDLLDYFNKDMYKQVDAPEAARMRQAGLQDQTPVQRYVDAIVAVHHNRAVGTMELGLTDVAKGFAQRRQKAREAAVQQEDRYNNSVQQLRMNSYPF